MEVQGTNARNIMRELDLKKHELKMCEEKLADSTYAQIANEVTALELSLVTLEEVRTCAPYEKDIILFILFVFV